MATHIVTWNFADSLTEEEKAELKIRMKENLEGLVGKVPGLLSARFYGEVLPGSKREMVLVTTHATAEDIQVYAKDPVHNAVADKYVRPYTTDRVSVNYE